MINVLAMRYDWQGSSVFVIYNFGEHPVEAQIRPGVDGLERLSNLLVEEDLCADVDGTHRIPLDALDYC